MRKLRKYTPDEDAPMLLSWHRGDLAAFETLVRKYLNRVYSLAFYLTGNDEIAAAATEGTFITAFATINTFSSRFHFSNWLLALALKEAREQIDYSDPVLSEAALKNSDLHRQLPELIRQIPSELAEVLVLRDVRGYSLERISEIFQLRTDILVARLFAAHEMLAALLKKGGPPPGTSPPVGEEKSLPHPEIRLSFHAYLDSSLSGEDAENIRKHLKSCGSCREALTGLEWIIEHLKKLPDSAPPYWLAAAIMQKVMISPAKPVIVQGTHQSLFLQLGAGLLLLAVIGLSAYLLQHDHETISRSVDSGKAGHNRESTSQQPPQSSKSGKFITALTIPFKSQNKPVLSEGRAVVPTVPLPPVTSPVESAVRSAPPPGITPAAVAVKSEPARRLDRIEKPAELPPEWGESLPAPRTQLKKAAPARSRNSGITVEMVTEDPVAANKAVENAVTTLGGEITGRAYSNGSDILYTRIDVNSFFDLMSRLGNAGRIQELPQLQEGVEGTVDLIIKWH